MKQNYYLAKLKSSEYMQEREGRVSLIARILETEFHKRNVIVDLGSGSGLIQKSLSKKFGIRILGIELNPFLILNKDDVIQANALFLPFEDKKIDLILCNNVFEHVDEQEKLLSEMKRVLKPDGIIYLTTGSRFQLIEPHYRLPFLSWLPRPLADLYVMITRRGTGYDEVKFVTYPGLMKLITRMGLNVNDVTKDVVLDLWRYLKPKNQKYRKIISLLPQNICTLLLKYFSPQWFLLLSKKQDEEYKE